MSKLSLLILFTIIFILVGFIATSCSHTPEKRCAVAGLQVTEMILESTGEVTTVRVECKVFKSLKQ